MPITSEIEIKVNGEQRQVEDGISIHELLEGLALTPALIVVERNGTILRRADYQTTAVVSGDTLELVHFVGGG